MDEHSGTSERFEEHRGHLRAVAYRMLGSLDEADDGVCYDARPSGNPLSELVTIDR